MIDSTIDNPSYSVMHSLSQGFSIVLFSGTHNICTTPSLLHRNNAVRLVLPSDMVVLWHERTYHGGAQSRLSADHRAGRTGFHLSPEQADRSPSRRREPRREYQHMEDLRLFGFVWNSEGKSHRTRSDGNINPGDQLHYNDKDIFCKDFFKKNVREMQCQDCRRGNVICDLSRLPIGSYENGTKVVGDLKTLGWAVFRSRLIGDAEESLIRNICGRGQWQTISQKRVMKYKSTSTRPATWNSELMTNFCEHFKSLILDPNLGTNNYEIHDLNPIKNIGVSFSDQRYHYNYKP